MAYDYDKLYRKTPDALGEPTAAFVEFFNHYRVREARVLDIGCGQGRDAVFIARLGHHVVGVDISAAGIACLLDKSEMESLGIVGEVADIRDYRPDGIFDVILIDRTLHMLAEAERHAVLRTLIAHIAEKGHLLIADERSNIAGFRDLLSRSDRAWNIETEGRGLLFASASS